MKFDDISSRMKKLGKKAMGEAQKLNEVRQLSMQVSAKKKKANALFADMGRKLYELYKEEPLSAFEQDFAAIAENFAAMEALKEQIRGVKGVTLCPCCNMEVGMSERFCKNCGNKMPEIIRVEEEDDEEPETAEDTEETTEEPKTAEETVEDTEKATEEPEEATEETVEATEEAIEEPEEATEESEEATEETAEVNEKSTDEMEAEEVTAEAAKETAQEA